MREGEREKEREKKQKGRELFRRRTLIMFTEGRSILFTTRQFFCNKKTVTPQRQNRRLPGLQPETFAAGCSHACRESKQP